MSPADFWRCTPRELFLSLEVLRDAQKLERRAEDKRAATVALMVYDMGRGKGTPSLSPGALFPSLRPTPEEQARQATDAFIRFSQRHNATRVPEA